MFFFRHISATLAVCISLNLAAQGPPIFTDNPIMTGKGQCLVRAQVMYRAYHFHDVLWMPLSVDYNILRSLQVSATLPFSKSPASSESYGLALRDPMLKVKYQFLRRDSIGHTLRAAAIVKQVFPTTEYQMLPELGLGSFQTYVGAVGGIEDTKYGIQFEAGANLIYDDTDVQLVSKASFGLPLLKPKWPVRQINLYAELEGMGMPADGHYGVYYAQGAQLAIRNFTFELAGQIPLWQNFHNGWHREYSLLAGTRILL